MSHHLLLDRTEDEILWFQRRSFLQAAASWTALGGWSAAHAQQRSNIVELMGDVLVNGLRIRPDHVIATGDEILTGPRTSLIFVIGNAAFQVRQNSRLIVERGSSISVVSVLRLLSGAVASVWGRGPRRQIVTPTLTAGIRGTGVYTEVWPSRDFRSYFCNCYGTVDLAAGDDRRTSVSTYHESYWSEPASSRQPRLSPANAINHSDQEIEFLARLVEQRTAWQISGQRGTKNMDDSAPGYGGVTPVR